jgi:hypothetical protein
MRRTLICIVFVTFLVSLIFVATASAQASVGVQSGDWIEYTVNSTGAPNQGHDVAWAHMEVTDVQTPNVTVKITSNYTDGSSEEVTAILNLETGNLIDDFIIPAGLNVGESFPDENYGNVTITGSEIRSYAGAQRTVLTATLGNNSYVWDQETGVSVEGNTTTSEYSIYSVASATNMWMPAPTQVQNSLSSAIMTLTGVLIIFGLIITGAAVRRHKKIVQTTKQTPVDVAPVKP